MSVFLYKTRQTKKDEDDDEDAKDAAEEELKVEEDAARAAAAAIAGEGGDDDEREARALAKEISRLEVVIKEKKAQKKQLHEHGRRLSLVRTDVCKVLRQHAKVVFGTDEGVGVSDADYTWYMENTVDFYAVAYREGCYSFPLPGCLAAVDRSFVAMVRHPLFEFVVNGTIGLVAVAFTLQLINKPDLSTPSKPYLAFFVVFVKYCSLFVFAGEMGAKVLAEGSRPLRYWTGPESSINTFDSTIVVLSFVLMGPDAGRSAHAILPVLRLARLVKLLNRTPETRRVLYGIIAGCRAMVSIIVLLTMIMFLYAIIGVRSFGENDPAHFGTVPVAMLTLFVASTCSDWSHLLAINYKGCDKGGDDWPYVDTERLTQFHTYLGKFYNYDCHDPTPRKLDAVVYFYTYTMLTAFVVLNLFISAIDMAMFDILYADKVEEVEDTLSKDAHCPVATAGAEAAGVARSRVSVVLTVPLGTQLHGDPGEAVKRRKKRASLAAEAGLGVPLNLGPTRPPEEDNDATRGSSLLRLASLKNIYADVEVAETTEELCEQVLLGPENATIEAQLDGCLTPVRERNLDLSEVEEAHGFVVESCRAILRTRSFPAVVIVCIVFAGLVEAFQVSPSKPIDHGTLHAIDSAILAVFVFECAVKITACGAAPYRYFVDPWNVFDFVVVCVSVLAMVPSARVPGIAMCRLFRLLKLVNFYPSLSVAVSSLLKASSNVFYATVVLVLVVYVYAAVGMLLSEQQKGDSISLEHECSRSNAL